MYPIGSHPVLLPSPTSQLFAMSGVIDSTIVSSVVDAEKKISRHSRTLFNRARYLVDGRL